MKIFIIAGISVYGGVDVQSIKTCTSEKSSKRVETNLRKKYINVIKIERTLKNVRL